MEERDVESLLNQANKQALPLKQGQKEYEEFFDVLSNIWRIADKYKLGTKITTTNFVMFGPQSAGKTTVS
jgi:hypothetical protein